MFKCLILCVTLSWAAGQCLPPYLPPCVPLCAPPPPPPPPPPSDIYQIEVDNCGPEPAPAAPVQAPSATADAIEKPVITLPASIPAPKIISASANCVKTVLKPQLYHQLVSVPVISKYLQTITKPVTEVITFNAIPICPPPPPPPPVCLPPPPPVCLPPPPPFCLPPPPPVCLPPPPPPPPVCLPAPPPFCLPPPPPVCLPPPPPFCLPPPPRCY